MKWFCPEDHYKSRAAVAARYPAAAKIAKACGGWMVFESYTDYLTWKNQVTGRTGRKTLIPGRIIKA